jgi:hypothetical protein
MALTGVWLRAKPKIIVSAVKIRELSRYWFPAALFLFHMVLWTIYLISYPYFPNTEPPDAVWHAEITLSVLRGAFTTPIAQAGFAGGSHILFAFVSTYFGLTVISAERVTAAFVESLSVLVAYCVFQRILPKLSADYAAVAYAVITPAGFVYYANVGAYPNIVGDFFVLTAILLAVTIQARLTLSSVLTAIVVEALALIAHVSVLIFTLLVVWFSVVVFTKFRPQFRAYVISNIGFFLLPLAAVLVASVLVNRELAYVSGYYLTLQNDLGLVLRVWLHNYLFLAGAVNFVLLIVAFVWTIVKWRKSLWPAFLAAWFTVLVILVLIGTQDSRMVLLSFVPGAGLIGILLSKLQETLEKATMLRVRSQRVGKIVVNVLMLLLVVGLAANGPSAYALSHAFGSGKAARQGQIYDSMVWIQTNTPRDSVVVSVGLPLEYRYLPILTNRTYMGDFQLNSTEILKLRPALSFNYVAVSAGFSGLNTFYASNAFRPACQNAEVVVFVVTT